MGSIRKLWETPALPSSHLLRTVESRSNLDRADNITPPPHLKHHFRKDVPTQAGGDMSAYGSSIVILCSLLIIDPRDLHLPSHCPQLPQSQVSGCRCVLRDISRYVASSQQVLRFVSNMCRLPNQYYFVPIHNAKLMWTIQE